MNKPKPFTAADPKCADVLERLKLARQEMIRRGVRPLVRANKKEAQRPTWQRIEVMSEAIKETTVVPMRKRK